MKCPTLHKTGYKTLGGAKGALTRLKKNGRPERRAYFCTCGKYHSTSWTLEEYEESSG